MKKGEYYVHYKNRKVYEIVEVAKCRDGGPDVVVYREARYEPTDIYWRFATAFKRKFSLHKEQ